MKKLGLIGGMSWESTELYYRNINNEVKAQLGGHHSALLALESVDFQPIKDMQFKGDWQGTADVLVQCAKNLEQSGAQLLLICTNTMHKVAPEVQDAINIPLVHLVDATAQKIIDQGMNKIGFLGTKFSMEDDFYVGRLRDKFGLDVIVPNQQDREFVHKVIYEELCLGVINDESRQRFIDIMQKLKDAGAQGVIEGCTEIVLLVNQSHTDIPLFDTTTIHAQEAVRLALA